MEICLYELKVSQALLQGEFAMGRALINRAANGNISLLYSVFGYSLNVDTDLSWATNFDQSFCCLSTFGAFFHVSVYDPLKDSDSSP
jgi:hypothetical protein